VTATRTRHRAVRPTGPPKPRTRDADTPEPRKCWCRPVEGHPWPLPLATYRDMTLVSVIVRHHAAHCGLADEPRDLAEYGGRTLIQPLEGILGLDRRNRGQAGGSGG
jgi:hypothetical protein